MKEDKTLTCCECGNEFTFTASEQEFYGGSCHSHKNASAHGAENHYL